MKIEPSRFSVRHIAFLAALSLVATTAHAQPQITSWLTKYSGQYARIYANDANKLAGTTQTTWNGNPGGGVFTNTYTGIHEVDSSATWVYLKSSGLGSHVMGPWYTTTAHTTLFMNMPSNQFMLFRIPLKMATNSARSTTGGGPIGIFVDGVVMFDSRDAFSYTSGSGSPGTEAQPGSGNWNRDAYVNESQTFDPALAHQPGNGQYHYHANPPALRHLLGDNILFDTTNKVYSENVANTNLKHSPILGWVRDGLPVYGPYGYSNATNPASGVRRMISGFVLRDINDSAVANRTTLPAWAVRAQGLATNTFSGPAVSTNANANLTRPFGRYMEDNEYRGDLGQTLGVDFDLNEQNARYCVTPEFPGGTWAYFTCVTSNGLPAFPYNIGRQYYGSVTNYSGAGGNTTTGSGALNVATPPETVTTNFVGGPGTALQASAPTVGASNVTLTWSSIDGGTYQIEATGDLTNWASIRTNLPAAQTNFPAPAIVSSFVETNVVSGNAKRFYRVRLMSTNAYDMRGY